MASPPPPPATSSPASPEPPSANGPGPGPVKKGSRWLIAVLGIVLIGVVTGAILIIQSAPNAAGGGPGGPPGDAPAGMPPAAVFVAPVPLETAQDEAIVTGSLRARSRAEVAARESGAVEEVFVDEGDVAKVGDVLVRLDPRRVEALLAEARARVVSAQNLVEQREAELKRATEDYAMKAALADEKAISLSELLDAERTLAVARSQRDAAGESVVEASSQLDFLTVQREDMEIRAPFTGLVASRHVEPGEWVAPGQLAISMLTTNPVEAWLQIPERYLSELASHPERVRIRIANGSDLITPLAVQLVPDVDPRSRLFTVIATLENPGNQLAPGLSVTASVPVGEPVPHLAIPVDAVVRTRSDSFVFAVRPPDTEGALPVSARIPVEIAFERAGIAYALPSSQSALRAGDQVVVEGNDRLQPGQSLLVREAGVPEPGARP